MTYVEIFEKAKAAMADCKTDVVEGNLAAQINITGEGEGVFYIEVKDGALNVEPYNYYDNNCVITVADDKVVKMTSARIDLLNAAKRGDLTIEGDMDKAALLNKLFKSGKKPAAKKTDAKEEKPAKAKKAAK
ncbi:MAG: SCP2 sterol-binding domain-containing protein [Clostridia bacterium]|nr:SCP2 sterol-binding domain-containing protein [Clostridia bacterium]